MTTRKKPWALAIIYMVASLAIEAAFMIVGNLKPPQDNAILAPVVLTIPPMLAAWICGYRRLRELATAAILLSVLTLTLTVLVNRLTGIATGMMEPIINRSLAGFLAGVIANRLLAKAPKGDWSSTPYLPFHIRPRRQQYSSPPPDVATLAAGQP